MLTTRLEPDALFISSIIKPEYLKIQRERTCNIIPTIRRRLAIFECTGLLPAPPPAFNKLILSSSL